MLAGSKQAGEPGELTPGSSCTLGVTGRLTRAGNVRDPEQKVRPRSVPGFGCGGGQLRGLRVYRRCSLRLANPANPGKDVPRRTRELGSEVDGGVNTVE